MNPSAGLRSELIPITVGKGGGMRSREGMVTWRMTPRSLAWVTEWKEVPLVMIRNTEDGADCRGS